MYDIAIITSIYGEYDNLKPVVEQNGAKVEWVYVTDNFSHIKTGHPNLDGYTFHYQPREGLHPNRAAKFPKMRPWDYTSAPCSIWIDGSFRVTSPFFARDILKNHLELCNIAQFKHPWRDCVYDEAAETMMLARYQDVHHLIPEQMMKYRNVFGHPDHWGLWATGVIARNHNVDMKCFGEMWLNENMGHSYQDQLSEAPMLRHNNIIPIDLPGTHFSNPWLSYEGSVNHH